MIALLLYFAELSFSSLLSSFLSLSSILLFLFLLLLVVIGFTPSSILCCMATHTPPSSTTSDSWDGQRIEFDRDNFGPPEILPEELTYHTKIGGGCFGSVFRGECRGKEVAIKKLFRQDLSEKALNDFKKEVEICRYLFDHCRSARASERMRE
jgi:hypothetical protein